MLFVSMSFAVGILSIHKVQAFKAMVTDTAGQSY